MLHEIHERESLEQWWCAGALPPWVCWVVATAAAVSVTAARVGARALWEHAGRGRSTFEVRNGLALGLALAVAAAFLPPSRTTSRWLRLALLLPLIQLLGMAAAWVAWTMLAPRLAGALHTSPLVALLPLPIVTGALAVVVLAAGRIAARHRRDWLHATTMVALLDLLLLGLWLPLLASFWCRHDTDWPDWAPLDEALRHPAPLVAWVLAPPLVAATALTRLVHRARALLDRYRLAVAVAFAIGLGAAVCARLDPTFGTIRLYANFVHVLFAAALVAIGALLALAISLDARARRARAALARDPHRVTGTLAADPPLVGRIEIASWLRGPHSVVMPCAVTTLAGELHVPGGAELVARVPAITTRLAAGESVVVLRAGDRVEVSGFVPPPEGHPFRDSAALVPGPAGIQISRAGDAGSTYTDLALSLWRPCVAYLLILAAVALPGLATALHGQ